MHAASPGAPLWACGPWRRFRTPDRRLLLLSVVLQLVLAVILGHSYDTRVFMAAGYLVGNGLDPYAARDLGAVFRHPLFESRTTIGYPPPWPLALGGLWRLSALLPSGLLVYGLLIKLPVIASTVALAYLVAAVVDNAGAPLGAARAAWTALLFNPLVLYAGAAWGQIDVIVALLSVAALVLVSWGRWAASALLLALAVTVKPVGWPILIVVLVFLFGRSPRRAAGYLLVVLGAGLFVAVVPFLVLPWDPGPILRHPNEHFLMSGAMSYTTVVRLVRDPLVLPGHWWFLGMLWVPAVAVAAVLTLRHGVRDLGDLAARSAGLVLVFVLARTWVAEPNVVVVVPLVLIPVALERIDRRLFTALWAIPLAFTVANLSPLQLLWAAFPGAWARALAAATAYREAIQLAKAALAAAWQVAGWWLAAVCLRRPEPAAANGAAAAGGAPPDAAGLPPAAPGEAGP